MRCDYCKKHMNEPAVGHVIAFCEPPLRLHFCSNECLIRNEADMFTKGTKKDDYLKAFLPKAIAKDKLLDSDQ